MCSRYISCRVEQSLLRFPDSSQWCEAKERAFKSMGSFHDGKRASLVFPTSLANGCCSHVKADKVGIPINKLCNKQQVANWFPHNHRFQKIKSVPVTKYSKLSICHAMQSNAVSAQINFREITTCWNSCMDVSCEKLNFYARHLLQLLFAPTSPLF